LEIGVKRRAGVGSAALLVSGVSFLALSAAWVPAVAGAAGALPSGGQFSAGSGSIAASGNGLKIDQSSSRGIINWQNFSIGQGQSVQIDNGSGATLNRVTGGTISSIAGSLTATGSVYLVNPAGVVVMPTGQVVTTGSFVASTRDLSDSSFLAGKTQEFTGSSSGTVVNQGSITSSNGDVVLIGQSVSNSGQISAAKGTAALAAGDDVLLQQGGDQTVVVNAGTGNVTNSGSIAAAQAELAAADGNVYALATNTGGVIRATGTTTKNGHVYLTSDDGDVAVGGTVAATNADGSGGTITAAGGATSGSVTVSGTLNASATGKTAKGGKVTVTASNVTVQGTAVISADGGGAGGRVLIGGDRHGGSTASQDFSATPVANAKTTTVASGASISASGGKGGNGAGGDVVVWSDQSTSFAGTISATGGAAGGNGGFVEVSGQQVLAFTGSVYTNAPLGVAGTLLRPRHRAAGHYPVARSPPRPPRRTSSTRRSTPRSPITMSRSPPAAWRMAWAVRGIFISAPRTVPTEATRRRFIGPATTASP
jgi:filamentous hemagglutinin family protein